jgi:hypothetical protein
MSIFSSIGKFLRKAIPKEIGSIAPFIPGVGGVIAGVLSTTRDIAGAVESRSAPPNRYIKTSPFDLPTVQSAYSAYTPQNFGAFPVSIASGAMAAGGAIVRALPGAGRVASRVGGAVGRVIRSPAARRAGAVVGAAATAGAIYDAAGNLISGGRKRYRRVNPLNYRAAMRAVRRIKGARKALQRIERTLPKRHSTAARCAPAKSARC